MKIAPTLDGGLAIEPSSDIDWEVLAMIVQDIGGSDHLSKSLASLMVDGSEWEEYVMPDLTSNFNAQANHVAAAIKEARSKEETAIFIHPEKADVWYGALNQARLALESRYQLSDYDDFDEASEDLRSAYFRDRFYCFLQSTLLEYVMGQG